MPKMNVSYCLTRDYEENSPGWLRKNKPNSNPINSPILSAFLKFSIFPTAFLIESSLHYCTIDNLINDRQPAIATAVKEKSDTKICSKTSP